MLTTTQKILLSSFLVGYGLSIWMKAIAQAEIEDRDNFFTKLATNTNSIVKPKPHAGAFTVDTEA